MFRISYRLYAVALLFIFATPVSAQILELFGGNSSSSYSGNGIPAVLAGIPDASSGIFDKQGNYYYGDCLNAHRVRKIDPLGIITTVVGNGVGAYSGDGGPALSASIDIPVAVAMDSSGNLFVADANKNVIRRIDAITGIITTYAGTGTGGYSGDGGPATSAQIWNPEDICFDKWGNLYIAEIFNRRIRKVDPSGIITTVAGTGAAGFSGDGIPAILSNLNVPVGLTVDDTGNLYIADNSYCRLRKVNTAGIMTTIAGDGGLTFTGGGIPATSAHIVPIRVRIDKSGNIYLVDQYNYRIYHIDPTGIIECISGDGVAGFSGTGGPAINARFYWPTGVALDSCGNVYLPDVNGIGPTDSGRNIRRIMYHTPDATTTPTVSITAAPDDTVCAGTAITLTGTFTGGGSYTAYQWYKNGVVITGATGAAYTYTPTGNDSVRCQVTSTYQCTTPASGSATVHVSAQPVVTPSVSISAPSGDTVCTGTVVTFTATASGGGTSPAFTWLVNGVAAGTGTTYGFIPADGDSISCALVSSAACITTATDTSAVHHLHVVASGTPAAAVSAAPNDTVCAGTVVALSATATLGGTTPGWQWWINGSPVAGATDAIYSFTPANDDSARVVLTSSASCALVPIVSAGLVHFVVDSPLSPVISIASVASAVIGSTVTVNATVAGAGAGYTVEWYMGGVLYSTTTVPQLVYTKGSGDDVLTATVVSATPCHDSALAAAITIHTRGVSVATATEQPISLYPNPAGDRLWVSHAAAGSRWRISTVAGVMVSDGSLAAGSSAIELTTLPPGIYLLELAPPDAPRLVLRLVKR